MENARLSSEREESMQTYVRQGTRAQEEERLRIARELHDETAQELISLVRKLEVAALASGQETAGELQDGLAAARATLRSVRRFSRDLRPSILDDLGLLPALEMVVSETNGRLPGGAELHVTGTSRRLDPQLELVLFRIAQEGLHNVEKHARAQSAAVDVTFTGDEITLGVTDNGVGLSLPRTVSDLARVGKLGILGMKERAELVGGVFELQSGPGQGTRVGVRVKTVG